jgi:hypothetical protein
MRSLNFKRSMRPFFSLATGIVATISVFSSVLFRERVLAIGDGLIDFRIPGRHAFEFYLCSCKVGRCDPRNPAPRLLFVQKDY